MINKNRIGETNYNNLGTLMKIINYRGVHDIDILFSNDDCLYTTTYNCFKNGQIKSLYDKTVYGVGYIGRGKYVTKGSLNNLNNAYICWKEMLKRGYLKKYSNNHPTYKEVYVCDEWLNFQNFAQWYHDNYYGCGDEQMNLDKDILNKGNKIYSPKNCVFVPQRINKLFIRGDSIRGDFPIGVTFNKKKNNFTARCSTINERIFLGHYNTSIEAFQAYKIFKENYIKQVADEYKGKIPQKLYDAMYRYEVEITD